MKVTLTAAHDADIHSLYSWLRADRDLARVVRVDAPTGTDREAMGAIDTIAAVSADVIGLAQLAVALAGWRQARPRGAEITITRPDGHRLTVSGADAVAAEAISRFLTAGTHAPAPAGRRRSKA